MTEQPSIPVGYVRRAHGISGDVLVRGLAADASERFVVGAVLVTNEEEPRSFEVLERRDHKGDYMLTLDGIDDRNAAEGLVGAQFVISPADRRALDQDEWWVDDIVGCQVFDGDGNELGVVVGVAVGSSQDRLVMETSSGRSVDIPLVDELVPTVDVGHRRIVTDLPQGLLDL